MLVIIKEDNVYHQELITDYLTNIKIQLDLEFEIIIENTLSQIVAHNKNSDNVINIIDIVDDNNLDVNGVDFAKVIRETNRTSYIIFFTSHNSYLNQAVNSFVEPLAYINKTDPNVKQLLLHLFKRILFKTESLDKTPKIKFINSNSDILYIEATDIVLIFPCVTKQKHVGVLTSTTVHCCRGNLSDYGTISSNIVKTSKSTLVNKTKIKKISKGSTPKNKRLTLETSCTDEYPDVFLSNRYRNNLM